MFGPFCYAPIDPTVSVVVNTLPVLSYLPPIFITSGPVPVPECRQTERDLLMCSVGYIRKVPAVARQNKAERNLRVPRFPAFTSDRNTQSERK